MYIYQKTEKQEKREGELLIVLYYLHKQRGMIINNTRMNIISKNDTS